MMDQGSENKAALGRSIRLFLVDGSGLGLMVGEIVNWTGKIVVVPRIALAEFLRRDEAGKAGIYILAGTDPDDPFKPIVYVGESEVVGKRLREHDDDEKKDFFDRAIVFTSKDELLTKAHARYLERRLVTLVHAAGRSRAMNGNQPGGAALPEADVSDMEFFLKQIELILPVLGLDILRSIPKVVAAVGTAAGGATMAGVPASPLFYFEDFGLKADAQEIEGEFIVKAGSTALANEKDSCRPGVLEQRKNLLAEGALVQQGDTLTFTRDVNFKSPSGASDVLYGGSISGRKYWKVRGTGMTYGEWRKSTLPVVTEADAMTEL
jgi:hypothetical protein